MSAAWSSLVFKSEDEKEGCNQETILRHQSTTSSSSCPYPSRVVHQTGNKAYFATSISISSSVFVFVCIPTNHHDREWVKLLTTSRMENFEVTYHLVGRVMNLGSRVFMKSLNFFISRLSQFRSRTLFSQSREILVMRACHCFLVRWEKYLTLRSTSNSLGTDAMRLYVVISNNRRRRRPTVSRR